MEFAVENAFRDNSISSCLCVFHGVRAEDGAGCWMQHVVDVVASYVASRCTEPCYKYESCQVEASNDHRLMLTLTLTLTFKP